MSQSPHILITGASGQVGGELLRTLTPSAALYGQLHSPTRAELDLADPESIRRYVRFTKPRWIVNPAAYTAVDKAESEPALAHAINAEAPRILAEEARRINAVILHFSTDYVFDGTKPTPYLESDPTNPMSVYGRTKLLGEQALAASGAPHIVLRTSWVYGPTGKNFLLTILKLAQSKPELRIVADQHGAPTTAHDLATLAAHIITFCEAESSARNITLNSVIDPIAGVFHATSQGETTWHGFASEFLRLQAEAHPPKPGQAPLATLIPIPSSEYPTPAARPSNSRLNCEKLYRTFGFRLPPWQTAVARVFAQIPS